MDVLADVLSAMRIGGTRLDQLSAAAPWAVRLPDADLAAFHVVTQGTCWLTVPGQPAVQLLPGDVAFLPSGTRHVISSGPRVKAQPYEELVAELPNQSTSFGGRLELRGDGPVTRLMCGGYRYERGGLHPVLALLPSIVHVPASVTGSGLAATIPMLAAELLADEPGGQTVVDRLVDVLFVHILRVWALQDQRAHWLTALRDPCVAKALSAMHEQPARSWTVAELAELAGMSRAAFAKRFSDLVGEPPSMYLTRWRMDVSARRLRATNDSLAAVARSVGYASEFAFSRAFARVRGVRPSVYRAEQLTLP